MEGAGWDGMGWWRKDEMDWSDKMPYGQRFLRNGTCTKKDVPDVHV